MHAPYLAAHLVQHLPTVCPQLVLHPDGQVPAALLESSGIDSDAIPGVVPFLEVIEQLAGQPAAPRPDALVIVRRRCTAPSSARGRSFFLLPGQDPPDTVGAVVPVDEYPARLGHIVIVDSLVFIIIRSR